MENTSFGLFKRQKEFLDRLQKEQPQLFLSDKNYSEEVALPKIGITDLDLRRSEGYLRLLPQDFIVEEVRSERDRSLIESIENNNQPTNDQTTIFADLIKIGISTPEAVSRIAKELNIKPEKIGYAGLKDSQALTSQRIALPSVRLENLLNIKKEGYLLSNFSFSKGTISKGGLFGNAFTILVRTDKETDFDFLMEKKERLDREGFLNYYHTQRFAVPRLNNFILGLDIIKGNYQEAIKGYLTLSGEFDTNIIKLVRQQALENFGDWKKIQEIYSVMPYTFQNEMRIAHYLEKNPENYIGALYEVKDQTTLWVYAYGSLLFNKYLSDHKNELPEELPLIFSDRLEDIKLYEKYLSEDRLNSFEGLKPFKFFQIKHRTVPTRIYPKETVFKKIDSGIATHFLLDKGAYATTYLTNFFKLVQGLPLPTWINQEEVDTKNELKIGSAQKTLELLKDYIFSTKDEAAE